MKRKQLKVDENKDDLPATETTSKAADSSIGSLRSRATARAVLLGRQAHDKVWDLCGQWEPSFTTGPLLWLTQYTRTEDTHWLQKGTPPVAPFPRMSFFPCVVEKLLSEEVLFIEKSREMMTSWLACGVIAWMTQWLPKIQWIIQTEKEDKAQELIKYCRILYHRQDGWMRDRNPVVISNLTHLKRQNGSEVIAVPKGENQVRLYHPYGVLFDEAAFLPEFMQAYSTVKPVTKKIWAISSAGPGAFADECGSFSEELAD